MGARHHRLGRRRDIRLGGHRADGSFLFNSFTVYPEVGGAGGDRAMAGGRIGVDRMMLFRGVAIATLPWLSTKYAPMAGAVTMRRDAARRLGPSSPARVASRRSGSALTTGSGFSCGSGDLASPSRRMDCRSR
jgi:hypothetical protein